MAVGNPDLYRVKLPAGLTLDDAIRRYSRYREVIRAEKIPIVHITETDTLHVADELLIKFKPCLPQSRIDEVNKLNRGVIIGRFDGDPDLYHIRLPQGTDLNSAIRRYTQDPSVVHASKNSRIFPN
jgi:hypothetical protein